MLDVFRKASKTWVVKLLFALLTLSFVVWGVGDVVRGGGGRGPAIEVGKTSIPAAEVMAEFKREVERLQPLFGGKLTSEEARKMGILDRTIDSLIARTLVDEAARSAGLTANDDVTLRRIAANPAFRNQLGQFDREIFRQRLGRVGFNEDSFMKSERLGMIRGQMAETLTAGIAAPTIMVEPLLRWREERRVAETLLVRDDSVPLPPTPEAAELEAYYTGNTSRFMAPEYRALTVLLLRPTDVAGNVEIDEMMVREAYQARLEEFNTPERRHVTQIVLDSQAAVAKASDLVGQGKGLDVIAKTLDSPIIDLGSVERRDLPDGLAEVAFRLGAGATGQPIKTELGWHVVKVEQIQPGRQRPWTEVKGQIEQDLRREKALDGLAELANKVEDALGGGATLEEAAKRHDLKIVKLAQVDAQGRGPNGKPVADLPKSDQFLDVAFHTDPNTESPLTEVPNNGYFLLRVDGVTQPAPKPLAEVKAEVQAALQAERRHDQARAKAEKLAERLKAGESMAAVAQSAGLKVETTKPFSRESTEGNAIPPQLAAELFRQQPGGIALGALQTGTLVARLASVVAFDPNANPAVTEAARRRVSQAVANDITDQYLSALNTTFGVKVDRPQLTREE
ncbi:parvulin peptidyl-prolyl isomerase [Paramagnetospirillum marisnigri]|uniref:Parvulin-like PPIase n=1 Tax=Paramagnetospirillum marisnigri TaxID=1285242 RepID=A0A178MT95_9PROT|nr:SurA N-terminal domain-containing protein [Paramagnetospirillum marisnigri]OAN52896.1 parvulin peptidyl-prolyl isomerase [Paramagnetospirillum marisnigri]